MVDDKETHSYVQPDIFTNTLTVARYFSVFCVVGYGWAAFFDYSNGYHSLAMLEAVFALTGPVIIFLSLKEGYTNTVIWYAVGTSIASLLAIALTQLNAAVNLAWIFLFPFLFLFFTGVRTGLLLSASGLACLILGYATWESGNTSEKIQLAEFLQFALSYIAATALGALFETQRARRESDLRLNIETDELTQIPSRKSFTSSLIHCTRQAKQHDSQFCILAICINDFEKFVQKNGAGDKILKVVANTVQRNLWANDTAARWGEKQFIAILPGASLSGANRVAEKLRHCIANTSIPMAHRVTVNIAILEYQHFRDAATTLKKIDAAFDILDGSEYNKVIPLRSDENIYRVKATYSV